MAPSATPDNANPIVHSSVRRSTKHDLIDFEDDSEWERLGKSFRSARGGTSDDEMGMEGVESLEASGGEEIDRDEIFDLIRSITDPEHPLTLEQLAVVSAAQITVTHGHRPHVLVEFTPTIPHCSMATLIGLSLRVRLLRSLPERFKVDIKVKEGTHQSENAVNKQLNDKERVAAALENNHLVEVVQNCLSTADERGVRPT